MVQLPYCKGCSDGTHAIAEESNDMTVAKCLKLCDDSYFSLTKVSYINCIIGL